MIIRPFTQNDIDFAYRCVLNEGWQSETKRTFQNFYDYNPNGCFIGEVDEKPIGICVATKYRQYGFIGELIVIKKERGKGYGKLLFKHSVDYLQKAGMQSIFLDGDLDAIHIYEKFGFRKLCYSLRFLIRMEGVDHTNVHQMNEKDFDDISNLDKEYFGDDRSFFLKRKLELNPQYSLVAKDNNQITGYIMAKAGNNVIAIGPLAANDMNTAQLLLEKLALQTDNQPARIGVLESNIKAVEYFKNHGAVEEQTPCWRMVLGNSERLGAHEGLIGIGSPAKG